MTLFSFLFFQGVTFRVEQGEMVIARILHGSSIDRQGMLHTGDVILEVNGQEVGSSPRELQEMLKVCSGSVVLKVLPSYRDAPAPPQVRTAAADRWTGSSATAAVPVRSGTV